MVYAFGEILWDIFGDTRSIGGAPFNFAAHFASLGGAAALISAVGEDLLGDEALRAMRSFGVSERLVQRIAERPTGTCAVTLDGGGVPQYRLASETAFDAIGYTDALRAALACPQGDVLYFGTLAQRDETSRSTLRAIAARPFRERFCDLNLRPPFLDEEVILHACGNATILKLSLEECEHLRAIGLLAALRRSGYATRSAPVFQTSACCSRSERTGPCSVRPKPVRSGPSGLKAKRYRPWAPETALRPVSCTTILRDTACRNASTAAYCSAITSSPRPARCHPIRLPCAPASDSAAQLCRMHAENRGEPALLPLHIL